MYPHHIRCAHQSAPLHQLSPSECPFTSVPPYTQSTPFHHISPSECPFTSYSPSDCPFPSHVPIRVPFHSMCAYVPP
ncbi:unnamed protein product [Staurois parvus]|uniref:Uncharacterized protein n=1 Tax=Staurois parvus TaxID=386267 RepID=A0ABN9ALT4_9NEOB|nr:unnamed protein product [Staurois parvus]